eukprot:5188265-Pyramimonas_sp.AAC.1
MHNCRTTDAQLSHGCRTTVALLSHNCRTTSTTGTARPLSRCVSPQCWWLVIGRVAPTWLPAGLTLGPHFLDVFLCVTAVLCWKLLDNTAQGLFMCVLTAVNGPLLEIYL